MLTCGQGVRRINPRHLGV